jgi:hypothetical protein
MKLTNAPTLLAEICELAVRPNVFADLAEPDDEPPAFGKHRPLMQVSTKATLARISHRGKCIGALNRR